MEEGGHATGAGGLAAVRPRRRRREEEDAGPDIGGGGEELLGAGSGMVALEQDARWTEALDGVVRALAIQREGRLEPGSLRKRCEEPCSEDVTYENENYAILHRTPVGCFVPRTP